MRTAEDINREVKKLIDRLTGIGCEELARAIAFRLYEVAWTTQDEMLEDILEVLADSADEKAMNDPVVRSSVGTVGKYIEQRNRL